MATRNMPGSMFAAALGLLSSCVALDLSSLSSCVCASGPQLSRTLNFIHCSHVTEGQSLDHPDRRLSRLETRLDCEIPVQTNNMAMGQNAWNPLVNTEIAGEWMFIPPKYGIKGFGQKPYQWSNFDQPEYRITRYQNILQQAALPSALWV